MKWITAPKPLLSKALFLAFSFFWITALSAEPLTRTEVPEPLQHWVDWVLRGEAESQCPYLQGDSSERQCQWASALVLNLEPQSGSFTQQWQVDISSWIPLPGNRDLWPQGVQSNGQAVAVLEKSGRPFLYLTKGSYSLSGRFRYDRIPESFPIPESLGILRLTLQGQAKPFPQVDYQKGMLWLQQEKAADKKENRLEMRVHRKLSDNIPFMMTTLLTLNVSGQSREVVFDRVIPKGFVAMTLKSPIPARAEGGGKLRVQIKPGEWRIEIKARHLGPVDTLSLEEHPAPWPKEEVWVFQAENDLRLVWVEGALSIDPQQTTLPNHWKQLPAYRMKPGMTLTLKQKRRGDSDPAPDQLSLHREWWLDFNGGGFTLHDNISGDLRRSWRLEMNPPVQLGRISVDNKDQFITKLPGQKRLGIEMRQGQVDVDADSRINAAIYKIPAVGWNHDFQKVSGELNLPPGWSLFMVRGADEVPGTWIERWTLLDIFLVLITALAFFKLWGWKWGGIALLTFIITFPEADAPRWIWLALVAGFALLRVIPKGKIFTLVRLYRIVVLIMLFIFAIPFMIKQVRVGIYPALEYPYESMQVKNYSLGERKKRRPKKHRRTGGMLKAKGIADIAPAPQGAMEEPNAEIQADNDGSVVNSVNSFGKFGGNRKIMKQANQYTIQRHMNLQEQRPGTKVQTGPGLPRWDWNQYRLTWNGPVQKNQVLSFWLIPPTINLVLACLRVLMLALLILCVLEISRGAWKKLLKPRLALWFVTGLCLSSFLAPIAEARADFPSDKLLGQLKERLTETPECFPNCLAISQLHVSASEQELRLRLEVQAKWGGAIALPGGAKEWTPSRVLLNGDSSIGTYRDSDGKLWAEVGPGVHQLILLGSLTDKETLTLSLPQRPYQVTSELQGWSLEGLRENGVPDGSLQLTRNHTGGSRASRPRGVNTAQDGVLPPFVRVERELVLGLNWEVATRVVRVTPLGAPVVLEIPLLPGESVISQGIRVENGKALVNMAPTSGQVEWRSVLQESPEILLQAPQATNFMETWVLNVSPVWHVEFQGIPRIHSSAASGQWLPQWRPWPGEEVKIQVVRPEGVPGQTLTIDQSLTKITPGLRYTEITLALNLRSSLGGQHVLTLPKGSELQSVKINNKLQPIRLEGQKITLPVVPGPQRVEIKWQQAGGIGMMFKTPEVNLGVASVNSEIQIKMPRNRWVLFTWGPTMGPAVMFWALLVVLVLFAIGLSRLGWTPLGTWQWLLLGIGVSQFPETPVFASVFVVGWLLAVGWRQRTPDLGSFWFDMRQLALVGYTFFAIIVLFASIHQGLLGLPEMQIAGNSSSASLLRWFQDRSISLLERPWVISVPLFYYRLAMLAWALWIAFALLRWLKWSWQSFSTGALWKPLGIINKKPKGSS